MIPFKLFLEASKYKPHHDFIVQARKDKYQHHEIAAQLTDHITKAGGDASFVNKVALSEYIGRNIAKGKKRRGDFDQARNAKVIADIKSGKSQSQVAKEHGVSYMTVKGIKQRKEAKSKFAPHHDFIKQAREAGGTIKGIARALISRLTGRGKTSRFVVDPGKLRTYIDSQKIPRGSAEVYPERNAAIIGQIKAGGKTARAIGVEHGIEPNAVQLLAKKRGIKIARQPGNKPSIWTPERVKSYDKLRGHFSGDTVNFAERLGVKPETLRSYIQKRGHAKSRPSITDNPEHLEYGKSLVGKSYKAPMGGFGMWHKKKENLRPYGDPKISDEIFRKFGVRYSPKQIQKHVRNKKD